MKIKVGIFFGGPSREREISFAGGRTVYDNLNKSIFEPIPIFVDSLRNFILLDWQFVYKGTIRDFYPPVDDLPESPNGYQVYVESLPHFNKTGLDPLIEKVGTKILPQDLPNEISVAFLALHGEYGEDGQIQQLLSDLNIPYTGSGIRASQIGMDKALQKELMEERGFEAPNRKVLLREDWSGDRANFFYQDAIDQIGFPIVVRPANQGSSIGVSIVDRDSALDGFKQAVNNAFFKEEVPVQAWKSLSDFEKKDAIRLISDIRDGLGFPMDVHFKTSSETLYHPEKLLSTLNQLAAAPENENEIVLLESHMKEEKVILESFIHGKEFSCIVIRLEDDSAVALPPTEIVKGDKLFDYKSKYMPGFSRKVTPINLPDQDINAIRKECERLFEELGFQTYARIDGFINDEGKIFLNDPNTTSGMLPSSFFFHQAAEIGLNPSQFLTYIIRISIQERLKESPGNHSFRALMNYLDECLVTMKAQQGQKKKIGIILGGYSFERHISVESGRNIFEKLASSEKYDPVPIFLSGNAAFYELYQLPVNLLLKDNADDIADKIKHFSKHFTIEQIKEQCRPLTNKYGSESVIFEPKKCTYDELKNLVDGVFIALHGRPGEDGQVQMELEARNIPYNGSGIKSSTITINKYQTLQTLRKNGFPITDQWMVYYTEYHRDPEVFFKSIEERFSYPFVCKPVDDGCSSAVAVIKNRKELDAYAKLIFRKDLKGDVEARKVLKLKPNEEFPQKPEILIETLITAGSAKHFMEITGGLVTHYNTNQEVVYEIFEPSEALASEGVLSLEEKFLAGEGQNITPARFSNDPEAYKYISTQVKSAFEKAARILDVQGYARIDAFVRIFENNRAETIIIEINSLPGMTPATVIFHQAALNGYKPYNFIDQILEFAFGNVSKQIEPTAIEQPVPNISASFSQEIPKMAINPNEKATVQTPREHTGNSYTPKSNFSYFIETITQFLRAPIFLRNCLAISLFLLAVFILLNIGLRLYTKHGSSKKVPSYVGMLVKDANKKARQAGFRLVVSDSVFVIDRQPNIIVNQTPTENMEVKGNRRIFLTVTSSTAPLIPLPSLVGNYDYIQYTKKLERLGIRSRIKEKVFDRKQEENTIMHFFYNDEMISDSKLKRGVKVPKGSLLEFVITERNTGKVEIPNLVCKRFKAASFMLSSMDLKPGDIFGPVEENSFVIRQEPAYEAGAMIDIGTPITIYLSDTKPVECPEEVDPGELPESDTTSTNNF